MKLSQFNTPEEVLGKYTNARSIGSNRYIFNIRGNRYRLVIKISFELKTIWIRFIGTHSDYDKINALQV
jgi:mRNA interferase HigB